MAVVTVVWLALSFVGSSRAATWQYYDDDEWHIISPIFYTWLLQTEGHYTAQGVNYNANLSMREVLENSDLNLQFYFEADKGDWGFSVEPAFLDISQESSKGGVQFDNKIDMILVDFAAQYRVWKTRTPQPMSVYAYVGARYWNFDNEANGQGAAPNSSAHLDIIDPVVGGRFRMDVTDRMQLAIRGDIGGFGLSDKQSHLTWQTWLFVGYDVTKYFWVFGGYRAMALDYSEGHGAGEKGADITFYGPVIGLDFDFFSWIADRKK